MGLTSGAFVLVLAVAAVVIVVACIWLLTKVRGTSLGQFGARFGMVAFTQAFVLFTVLVAVNASSMFYASWGDLLGENGNAPVQVHVRPGDGPATPSGLKAAHDARLPSLPAGSGSLQYVLIHGQRTGIDAPGYIYLPPQYSQASYRTRRFPVVLVITSSPQQSRNLVTKGNLAQTAAQQIASGKVQPTVYLVTDLASTGLPGEAGCLDVPGGRQAETYFTQDIPSATEASYRVASGPDGWGLYGYSDSYCAAKLAMRRSDQFTAAAFPAGSYAAPQGNYYGGSTAIRNENDLLWRLAHHPPPPVDLLVLAGGRPPVAPLPAAQPPLRIDPSPAAATDLPTVMQWLNARLSPGA
jgi:hypothetical protein